MENLGKEMVKHCCGLPLAIVVLGGVLAKRSTLRQWQMVQQNIHWYLAKGEGHHQQKQAVTNVLGFSYHDLPYKFKQCFLYLANFPEDCEINAEKLYQFWLAEGMVSYDDRAEEETMMDVAERYLSELAQRCLVQIRLKETTGSFKTCRLHDLMRDLCLSKVREENFSKIIDSRHGKNKLVDPCVESSEGPVHRVSMYIGANSKGIVPVSVPGGPEYGHHTRSVFIYANNDCRGMLLKKWRTFFSDFKLLRVLDLQGFHDVNDEVPESIGGLIHLRYLSIRNSLFKKLPCSLGRLKYLQTLDLEVTGVLVQIPNVLWKLERLRHIYLPAQFYTKCGTKLRFDGLINLEILINFDTSLCNVKDLEGLVNLRKLRTKIREKLDDLPVIIDYLSFKLRRFSLSLRRQEFSSRDELSSLTELLGCPRLNKLFICGRIEKLPNFGNFSPSLTKLSFQGSQLQEDAMKILEKLPKLSSLTFLSSSFVGEEMVCSDMGFPQLTYLKLWDLLRLGKWKMNKGGMRNLSRLVVAYCDNLEMLPDGLQFICTLQKLNVRWMPKAFKNRLRTVDGFDGEDFYKVQHIPEIKLD